MASIGLSVPAAATPAFREAGSKTVNYRSVDDSEVSTCLAAGAGDIRQAAHFDQFLTGPSGAGWIGFKFGTGNQLNEWFVYSLQDIVSSGNYAFFNMVGTGGSLSHLVLNVSGDGTRAPEPGTWALLGLGLAGMAVGMRRRRQGKSTVVVPSGATTTSPDTVQYMVSNPGSPLAAPGS